MVSTRPRRSWRRSRASSDHTGRRQRTSFFVQALLAASWVLVRPSPVSSGPQTDRTVNVGILGTIGYFAYTKKDQRWDQRIVAGTVAGTLALFGAEG